VVGITEAKGLESLLEGQIAGYIVEVSPEIEDVVSKVMPGMSLVDLEP